MSLKLIIIPTLSMEIQIMKWPEFMQMKEYREPIPKNVNNSKR